MNTNAKHTPSTAPHRTVYVVRREMDNGNRRQFIAAELGADGAPREHSTAAEAHAAAARLGGAAAGFRVLEEWRTAAGAPCLGPFITS